MTNKNKQSYIWTTNQVPSIKGSLNLGNDIFVNYNTIDKSDIEILRKIIEKEILEYIPSKRYATKLSANIVSGITKKMSGHFCSVRTLCEFADLLHLITRYLTDTDVRHIKSLYHIEDVFVYISNVMNRDDFGPRSGPGRRNYDPRHYDPKLRLPDGFFGP